MEARLACFAAGRPVASLADAAGVDKTDATGWAALVFIGVSSGIGYMLWLTALGHASPTHATLFLSLTGEVAGTWASVGRPPNLICGVGFTMSLFIGMLAFPADAGLIDETKIGVLMGSLASALAGAAVLLLAKGPRAEEAA